MNVNLENLLEIQVELKKFLERYVFPGVNLDLIDSNQNITLLNHPAYRSWINFLVSVSTSLERNSLIFNTDSIFLLEAFRNCQIIESVQNSTRMLNKLSDKDDFYATLHEIYIASLYKNLDYSIKITDEGKEENKKTCDFIVEKDSIQIAIEAKYVDDLLSKEIPLWLQLKSRIENYLIKNKRIYSLHISAKKRINGTDIDKIFNDLKVCIKRNFIGKKSICNNSIDLDYFIPNPDNKNYIIIKPYIETNISRRVKNQITTASKQFPVGLPCIVHVGLPFSNSNYTLQVVDESYNHIFHTLKQRTSINAVIITSVTQNQLLVNDGYILNYDDYIVSSPNPKNPLPENLFLPVTHNKNSDIPLNLDSDISTENIPSDRLTNYSEILASLNSRSEGTIFLAFDIHTPIEQQVGRTIFIITRPDGRGQIRLWIDYNRMLRVEIINPIVGRLIFTSKQFIDIPINTLHILTIIWKKNSIKVFLNSKELEF